MSLKGAGVTFAGIAWSAPAKAINLLKSLTRNVCVANFFNYSLALS